MSRRTLAALLLCACLVCAFAPTRVASADVNRLLVLYDCDEGTTAADTFALLKRQMMYMNEIAEYVPIAQMDLTRRAYTGILLCVQDDSAVTSVIAERLLLYGAPILVIGQGGIAALAEHSARREGSVVVRCEAGGSETGSDFLVRAEGLTLLDGETEDLGGTVFVGAESYPLCQRQGLITHIAYMNPAKPQMRTALATLIQRWLWPYENEPTGYGYYLVLDCAYPFDRPARLMELTDALTEVGVPFSVSVMPIYANAEYPAMKRFCEYLRYLQGQGVGIILRAPLVDLDDVEAEDMLFNIRLAYEAYSRYGVYPLAIEVPEEYLLCQKGLTVVAGFRTTFLFEATHTVAEEDLAGNIAYSDGHQIVAPGYADDNAYASAYAQAIYLDANAMDADALRETALRLVRSERSFKRLTDMATTLYVGYDYISWGDTGLYVNGRRTSTAYTPFTYEGDYDFDRGFAQYLTDQIKASNQLIIFFVLVSCALLLGMILLSRRMMRRNLILGRHGRKPVAPDKKQPDATEGK